MIGSNPLLIHSSGAAPAYESLRSVRFDGGAKFSRTPSFAGNDMIGTISFWLKSEYVNDASGYTEIFTVNPGTPNCFNVYLYNQSLMIETWNGATYPTSLRTTRLLRDHTEWIHVVIRVDTTQYVAKHRIRIYFNGVLETNVTNFGGGAPTYPAQFATSYLAQTVLTQIGQYTSTTYYRGYLDDFVHADGLSYGPWKFGERSSKGQWVPKNLNTLNQGKREVVGTDVIYESGGTANFNTVCKMDATRSIVAYTDENNSRYITAVCLTTSGNTVTVGSGSTIAYQSYAMEPTCLTRIDATHAIVGWEHPVTGAGSACVMTLNGDNTITFGTPVQFTGQNTNQVCMCLIDSTHVLLTYVESTSYYTVARVLTISGDSITDVGATTQISSGDAYSIGLVNIDSTHCLMAYADGANGNRGTAVVLTISGSTVTANTQFLFESYVQTHSVRLSKIDNTRYLVTYGDMSNSYHPFAVILVISGTTVKCGPTKKLLNRGADNTCNTVLSPTQALLVFRDTGNSNYGTAIALDIEDTVITPEKMFVYESANSAYQSVCTLDATHALIVYQDAGNNSYGTTRVLNLVDSACGCWLKFDDSSDVTATTLGKDSAYGNNWTPSGFSASATNDGDIRKDTPTNNYATLQNIRYPLLTTQSNGNLDIGGTNTFAGVSTIELPTTGKWAMEAVVSGDAANGQYYGVCENTDDTQNSNDYNLGWMNTEDYDCCFYTGATASGGQIYTKTGLNSPVTQQSGLGGLASGEHIRIEFDSDARTVTFFREGTQIGTPQSLSSLRNDRGWLFYVAGHNLVSIRVEFDTTRFNHAASSGYQSLCTKNLPVPAIEVSQDYFDVVKYPQTLRIEPEFVTFIGKPDSPFNPASLVDDTLTAGFYTLGTSGHELVVDMQVPVKVGTMELYPGSTNVATSHVWTVWYSDDNLTWTATNATLTMNQTAGWRRAEVSSQTEHRYWKLVKDSNTAQTNWVYGLRICGIKDTTTVIADPNSTTSLRFDGTASLSWTPTIVGDRRTLTLSMWVKRCELSSVQYLFNTSDNNVFYFHSDDSLRYYNGSAELVTTRLFRDPTEWYHIVFTIDTPQAIATNRAKMHINGVQVTEFSASNYPAQNADTSFCNTVAHYIGNLTGSYLPKVYLDDVCLINGQALGPDSFGQFDVNGQWVRKDITALVPGKNGFYLPFEDRYNPGSDYFGSNDWAATGFSTQDGAGLDVLSDCNKVNYCTLDPLAQKVSGAGQAVLSDGLLVHTGSSGTTYYSESFGTMAVSSGKWYWEVEATNLQYLHVGIIDTQHIPTAQGGNTQFDLTAGILGYGYNYGNGSKIKSNTSVAYGNSFTTGDVIGVALDLDNGKIWWSKNGTWQAGGDPVAGTNAAYTDLLTSMLSAYAPAIAEYNSKVATVNFGQRPFSYTQPTGYYTLCSDNLTVEI